ncbi:ethanolamine ammonia-lyase subunit EutC [Aureimonas sp. Leaf324]|jgi:ethanolamine ammonia-lyase large subunit/ethanolamine ammonia-lyase small subunit|uniref:ethanolamine ammonia-lyase subunit EutC n=1 Tax=Aureimonas sp. Leaf324 TaxID=1736336 RepID=UPI0006F28A88|nr:ethanolamine ammonia-lyase subunit EutC [Aureimonas sp. Leaf324]KQQ79694.1 ethanolamine ammonia-lyase [Aureimonas sp. Leaf324]
MSAGDRPVPAGPRPLDLRRLTGARVALGEAGGGMPTSAQQRFLLDHARAREAVWTEVDWPEVRARLGDGGLATVDVASRVGDRAEYLRRPDLGRRLSEDGRARLAAEPTGADVALVIADGLSATAVTLNAAPLALRIAAAAAERGWRLAPIALAHQARVALGDEVGAALGARAVVLLVGERPGLSAADSLGVYITHAPAPGTPDSRRNCISNVREGGLPVETAAAQVADLLARMFEQGRSGVELRRDAATLLPSG